MTNSQLAKRILAERTRNAERDRARMGRHADVPYYMLNIRHPAVAAMYDKWRAAQGPQGCPPGDLARTLFELDMLTPAGRQLLEQHYELIDRMRGIEKGDKDEKRNP